MTACPTSFSSLNACTFVSLPACELSVPRSRVCRRCLSCYSHCLRAGAGTSWAKPTGPKQMMTELSTLATVNPMPLGGVTTVGRVTYVFGHTASKLACARGATGPVADVDA